MPTMLRVLAGRELGLRDVELCVDRFNRFAVVVAGLQSGGIGAGDFRFLAELVFDVPQRRLERPIVEPEDETHREEVAAAVFFFLAELQALDRETRQFRHRHFVHAIRFERAVFERAGFVAGLIETFAFEGVAVDDQDAAGAEVAEVGGECGRVHGDERVDRVAGRVDVFAREVDLETRDAGERALRARISAGKSGNVAMSLPIRADVLVNCVPANCMPSPESPQNRTVASSSVRTCLSCLSSTAVDIAG